MTLSKVIHAGDTGPSPSQSEPWPGDIRLVLHVPA